MTSTPPPLPDMLEVLNTSDALDAIPGLKEAARLWLAAAPGWRATVTEEALLLSTPSLRVANLRALGRTGALAARSTLPGLRGDLRRIIRDGTDAGAKAAALRNIQEVVKAGGSTFVKLGQFVATAEGLLPDEWVQAFGWCRDKVPSLPRGQAELRFEETFGASVDQIFSSFDPIPLGAASIGQVHAATMHDGREVVVKIRRPGLRERFASDLRSMALAAAAADRASEAARIANLPGFVELFSNLVMEEVDFRFEALNMVELTLAARDAGQDYMGGPLPIPHLVSEDILVMTKIPGVPYTQAMEAFPDKVDGEKLLRSAITGVLEHTLAYGIFHGDLHAGNVLISPEGDFAIIDYGIAGRLDAAQRAALVRFVIGFARNDTKLQLKGLREFGAIPDSADLDELAGILEDRLAELDPTFLDRTGSVSVDQLSRLLGAIIRTLAANGFTLPKELILFFKNLLYLNGFAASLAPDTDLLAEIEPIFLYFMQRYPEQIGTILMGLDD